MPVSDLERSLLDLIAHHWGYRSLRPPQDEEMRANLDRRDSLVVLPTGGGKSLCYQAPALLHDGTNVVGCPNPLTTPPVST